MCNRPDSMARRPVTLMTVLSLFLLSLFAPGTMPTRAADGAFTIELCAADGTGTITLDANGQPVTPAADRACPWAVVTAATLPTLTHAPLPLQAALTVTTPQTPALPDLLRLSKHTHAQGPRPVFPV
jgi:hypothetical protein